MKFRETPTLSQGIQNFNIHIVMTEEIMIIIVQLEYMLELDPHRLKRERKRGVGPISFWSCSILERSCASCNLSRPINSEYKIIILYKNYRAIFFCFAGIVVESKNKKLQTL